MSELKDGMRSGGLDSRKGIKISFIDFFEEEVLSLLCTASGSIVYPNSAVPSKLTLLLPFFFLGNRPIGDRNGVDTWRLACGCLDWVFAGCFYVFPLHFCGCIFCSFLDKPACTISTTAQLGTLYGRFYQKAIRRETVPRAAGHGTGKDPNSQSTREVAKTKPTRDEYWKC